MHVILNPFLVVEGPPHVSLYFIPNFILVALIFLPPPSPQHLFSVLPSSFIVVESMRTVLLLLINYSVICKWMSITLFHEGVSSGKMSHYANFHHQNIDL